MTTTTSKPLNIVCNFFSQLFFKHLLKLSTFAVLFFSCQLFFISTETFLFRVLPFCCKITAFVVGYLEATSSSTVASLSTVASSSSLLSTSTSASLLSSSFTNKRLWMKKSWRFFVGGFIRWKEKFCWLSKLSSEEFLLFGRYWKIIDTEKER